jgi:hypothetical protein
MHQTRITKKSRILKLYDRGLDVEAIADALATSTSYVANVLIESGRSVEYEDLYTTTSRRPYSPEARRLAGAVRFRDPEVARESVRRLEEAFHQFQREGNRRGQHRAQMLALVGKNRAAGIGKTEEANIFRDWLIHSFYEEQVREEMEGGEQKAA